MWPVGAPARRPALRRVAAAVLAVLTLVACTDAELPDEGPPPADTADQAPSGLRVAVVLAVEDGGTDTATVDQLRDRLVELDEERGAEIADLRVTVPDGPGFVGDIAALFAGDGRDLVCLLGDVPAPVVVDLADRFPATRFCAVGTDRGDLPANVQLIGVAQEELGFVLGAAALALAEGGGVAVLSDVDRSDRTRRRVGIAAALGEAGPVLQVPLDDDGGVDLDAFGELRDAADEDGELGAYVIDASPAVTTQLIAALPPGSVVAPARDTDDLDVAVRYGIDVGAIVARALDRLVDEAPADLGEVGFGRDAFDLDTSSAPEAVGAAVEAARQLVLAGEVDLDGAPLPFGTVAPGDTELPDGEDDDVVPDVPPEGP